MKAMIATDFDITWGQLELFDLFWLSIMILASVVPFIMASRDKTSIALAMVLSLLLVHFVNFSLALFEGDFFSFKPNHLLSVIPILLTESSSQGNPEHLHRLITSAWLHADFIHVLGNVLVIALAGVPLEQRLGARRWLGVYFLGLIGGNLAWIASHPGDGTPAIGASGAAFGILGAYMACWPDDKIEFPLLFLIRAWPVWLIAFVRLGLEIFQIYSIQYGGEDETNIAHMAHIGGFFLAYILARPIARGAPSPIGDNSDPYKGNSLADDMRKHATSRMGDLTDDPWKLAGRPLQGKAARVLSKLREEGDELETREAWLEELSENTICPICGGEIMILKEVGVCKISCSHSRDHLRWP